MRKSEERARGKLNFGTNHCTKISLIASWTCSKNHFLSLHPHYYSIEFFPSALNFPAEVNFWWIFHLRKSHQHSSERIYCSMNSHSFTKLRHSHEDWARNAIYISLALSLAADDCDLSRHKNSCRSSEFFAWWKFFMYDIAHSLMTQKLHLSSF